MRPNINLIIGKPPLPKEKKPVKTIQDAYLEVFFKGYQVRKNITPIPVEKETQRTLVKDVSEDLNRELKNDFIKRKTQREHTLDPLDIKNIRASEKEIQIEDSSINIDKYPEEVPQKNQKSEIKSYHDAEVEMIPQSIRNKKKTKKELSKLSSN